MKLSSSKTQLFCETSFKNDKLTRHLTSEFQYVSTIFKWVLQKYCACHEKVEPRHTKSCNCHAKWSPQSNISVTWNSQLFHGFCVGGFKHPHRKARNPCACHANRIVSPTPASVFATLTNSCACRVFCNVSKSLRLPRETHFEPQKTSRDSQFLTILTSKSLSRAGMVQILRSSTSKSVPTPPVFNDFDFRTVLARRRGANFAKLNFQKCSDHASFLRILTSESLSRAGVVQILSTSWAADPPHHLAFRTYLPRNYGKTQHFAQFLPAKKSLMSHVCAVKHFFCPTSNLRDLPATFSIVGS